MKSIKNMLNINNKEITNNEEIDNDNYKEKDNVAKKEIPNELENKRLQSKPKLTKSKWEEMLFIPNKNEIDNGQVNKEILMFYNKLCNVIDLELKKKNTSLENELAYFDNSNLYFRNILYIIYSISEGYVVMKLFDLDESNFMFSHQLLIETLNFRNLVNFDEYKSNILPAMNKLRREIGILNIEESIEFNNKSKSELAKLTFHKNPNINNVLNIIEKTNLPLGNIPLIIDDVYKQFEEIWAYIIKNLKNSHWNRTIKLHINLLHTGEFPYYCNQDDYGILNYLLSEIFNKTTMFYMNQSYIKQNENVKLNIPVNVLTELNRITDDYYNINNKNYEFILSSIVYYYKIPYSMKLYTLLHPDYVQNYIIMRAFNNNDFTNYAKSLLKEEIKDNVKILLLIGLNIKGELINKEEKLLSKLVPKDNLDLYKNIIENNKTLTQEIIDNIDNLIKKPIVEETEIITPRKTVIIDYDRVNDSKQELHSTIGLIDDFVDKDNNTEINEESIEETPPIGINDDYINILKIIINEGSISLETFNEFANKEGLLTGAYLNNINKKLYEYTEDQTLVLQESIIIIDEFYVDIIKEMII